MTTASPLAATVVSEVLRDSHRYAPGVEQYRPTLVDEPRSARRGLTLARDKTRDFVERLASYAGFTRLHFDPDVGGARLGDVLALAQEFEETYALLGDQGSKRQLVDLLKLRVLGPYHAPLSITPGMYRAKQAYVDRELRQRKATFEVSDPFFSPISLYRVHVDEREAVTLHSHSVDIVSIFLLNQYTYRRGPVRVGAESGDVVLDIGGCWGDSALYFASQVGPTGKVFTFEFDPENLAVMRANLALNPGLADRIEVVEKALWDSTGEQLNFVTNGRCTSVVGQAQTAEQSTSTITLDDFVGSAGIDRVNLVKMDVEGAELRVVGGAGASIKRFTPRLAIAAYHRPDDLVQIPRAIVSNVADYRLFLDTFSPVEEETVLFALNAG